ncbi:MAG: TIGR02221 family CRISPR-associated protein [Candidatus Thorarchaeota archaeon]|nr:TIGR02221 family CRISPR-associated protein [Candidatus Thorarchaeota archaeon]
MHIQEGRSVAKVLITFLGTTPYFECYYRSDGKTVGSCRFIQEALMEFVCSSWGPEDRIVLFLTPEAKKKHWVDESRTPQEAKELLEALVRTHGIRLLVRDIPSGNSVLEMWEIMHTIADSVQMEDEVHVDITHAFRWIPLLAVVVLNYVHKTKEVRISRILYGALHILGSHDEVEAMSVQERLVPIFDLTQFVFLMELTNTISAFLDSGSARPLGMTMAEIDSRMALITNEKGCSEGLRSFHLELLTLKRYFSQLNHLTVDIETCRADNIQRFRYDLGKEPSPKEPGVVARVIEPLERIILESINCFKQDSIENIFGAAKWCVKYNLVQQGYTLLTEGFLSFLIELNLGEDRVKDMELRSDVREAISCMDLPDRDISNTSIEARRIAESLPKGLRTRFGKMLDFRNDINHAGIRKHTMTARVLRKQLGRELVPIADYVRSKR